ncbi:Predicted amidohydrolase [Haloplanus vescus]|uniref:Predicted amidohydrolase n=1 Tax=Haloplanus vescus TaxID=555874 RepID=A0A1H3VJR1_9EURY|nr:carbon-nitrogen family hydrolase [Haloplanus vescus]SDZ75025.1 Predicted amidohydrolase [Haloplanus vescus]
MRVALAQLDQVAGDVAENLDRAATAVADAADRGADLVVLPELFTVGYFAFDSYARVAEGLDGPTFDRLSALAADHGVGLLAGSHVEDLGASAAAGVDVPETDGLANTCVFYDRDGTRRAVYRKHHLFGYESAETRLLTPGESLATVDFEGFTVGMSTCYDLRFPELYRRLADRGATLVCVPSAWPYPRVEHWETLARARAIENQCYVAAANGAAEFDDATLLGRSTVYDPWGTTLASAADDPTLVVADVDPDRIDAVREEFPALRDRRE